MGISKADVEVLYLLFVWSAWFRFSSDLDLFDFVMELRLGKSGSWVQDLRSARALCNVGWKMNIIRWSLRCVMNLIIIF